jgi:hypothetical protein
MGALVAAALVLVAVLWIRRSRWRMAAAPGVPEAPQRRIARPREPGGRADAAGGDSGSGD